MNPDPRKSNEPEERCQRRMIAFGIVLLSVLIVAGLLQRQRPIGNPSPEAADRLLGPLAPVVYSVRENQDFFDGTLRGTPLVGRGGMAPGGVSVPAGSASKGRVAGLRGAALRMWADLQEGDQALLPWFGEGLLRGTTYLRMEENGWLRFGGALEDGQGSFALHLRAGEVFGSILMPGVGLALEIRTDPLGGHLLVERPLSALLCWPAMASAQVTGGGPAVAAAAANPLATVPQINTKPGARGLIYVNFEGGVATNPEWNYGRQIVFAPAALSTSDILEVIERVAEDYAPFDVAISTIWADYLAAPVGRRTRIMVTPTTTALPNSGGVAMINAWSAAGQTMSSTVPGWVFTSTAKQVAEGVSHEAGHTFGLNHDGTQTPDGRTAVAYYRGHGGDLNDPFSWAPIMGESYARSQTQWSRGEYAAANNKEDDLAIIRRKINGVGYIDDSLLSTRPLKIEGGSFEVLGVVFSAESPVVYTFATSGGTLTASVRPQTTKYGNTDLKMEVIDGTGKVRAVSDLVAATSAQIEVGLPEGTYAVRIGAGSTGAAPWDGYRVGYPAYGALGRFVLAGSLTNVASYPELVSPPAAIAIVGEPFVYRAQASEGAVITQCTGSALLGATWDPVEQALKGVPLREGVYSINVSLREGIREVSRVVKVTVYADGLPALPLGKSSILPATTPESPWRLQAEALPWGSSPGSSGAVAVSGLTADGALSRLRYTVPSGAVANFWWKVSSEADCDFLECRVNGVVARDRDTGVLLQTSGVRDWSRQCVQVEKASVLEFVYKKDFALSEGLDRGWVGGLEIGQRPVFSKMPEYRRLSTGGAGFSLEAQVEQADEFQWKKDGLTLVDVQGPGRTISGARRAALSITGATAADSGAYVLEARNAFGVQSSRRVEVGVPGSPVVTQNISAGSGLRAGDTLLLTVGVACAKPFFVMWSKNGTPLRWTQAPLYQIQGADVSTSGRYSAVVVNAYGSVSAGEVNVQVR